MKKLFITPFNNNAILLYYKLKKKGYNINGFFDADSFICNKTYDGTGIYKRCYLNDTKVYVCANESSEAIRNELKRMGYLDENIVVYNGNDELSVAGDIVISDLYSIYPKGSIKHMEWIENMKKLNRLKELNAITTDISNEDLHGLKRRELFGTDNKIFLKQLEMIVTNRCSLRCEKCAAGMQYFKCPSDLNIDRIVNDYNRIIDLIDWTDRMVIIGGEPFLFSNLDKIIVKIFENKMTCKKIGGVKIITNGTIIPSQNVIETIAKYKVDVWISNYCNISNKVLQLMDLFKKNNISYEVMNINEFSDVIQLNLRNNIQTKESLLERRQTDCITRCRTVANGRFYLCSLLKTMDCLNILPFDHTNYIDLYDQNAKNDLKKMLNMTEPLPNACSFCNGCSEKAWNNKKLPAAKQSKTVIKFKKNRSL